MAIEMADRAEMALHAYKVHCNLDYQGDGNTPRRPDNDRCASGGPGATCATGKALYDAWQAADAAASA